MNDRIQTALAAIGVFLLADNLGVLEAVRRLISGGVQ
jgi:hypothetical protein